VLKPVKLGVWGKCAIGFLSIARAALSRTIVCSTND